MNTGNMEETLHAYLNAGMALVFFPSNSKGPTGSAAMGWNRPENCVTRDRAHQLRELISRPTNVGLAHAYSGTCSIDIDDLFAAREWLAQHNIDLDALFTADDSVTIDSGRGNHGKLIYRLPHTMPQKKITSPNGGDIIDFRCAAANGNTVQDCLPPSYNPDADAHYRWGGNGDYRNLPLIPPELLAVWQALVDAQGEIDANTKPFVGTIEHLDHLSLSHKTLTAIQTGVHPDAEGEQKTDRSWNLIKVLNAMVSKGASEQLIIATVTNPQYPISEKPLQRNAEWLQREISKAQLFIGAQKQRIDELNVVDKRTGEITQVDFQPAGIVAVTDDSTGAVKVDTKLVVLDDYLIPYNWMIDEFLYEGVFTFAGAHGVGKTTSCVPLAAAIAGLVQYQGINVYQWRNVVYVAEDTPQVHRVLYGLQAGFGMDKASADDRFKVLQARRRKPAEMTELFTVVGQSWRTVDVKGLQVRVPPLVVFDTAAANLQVDSENDNSQISDVIHEIRALMPDVPVFIICHTAKTLKRADAMDMTTRGAGAWEADVQGVFYLFRDEEAGQGIIYGGQGAKRRDSGQIKELAMSVTFEAEPRVDRFGRNQLVSFPVVGIEVSDADERKGKAAEKKQQQAAVKAENALMVANIGILHALRQAHELRESDPTNPDGYLSQTTLTQKGKEKYGNWTQAAGRQVIANLIESGKVVSLPVPKNTFDHQRGTPTFLVLRESVNSTGLGKKDG